MIRSLYTAATGMQANQTFVDNVSHNLANVNTVGYKKSKIEFEDLIYQNLREPGATSQEGLQTPTGIQIGLGTRVVSTQRLFLQGNLEQTGNRTDLAIEGEGFFQVRMPNGEISFTRDGAFKISGDGYLVNSQGYLLEPSIAIPDDATELNIDQEGRVSVIMSAGSLPEELGQIELARFINPAGLRALGGNLYAQTEASGFPIVGNPGQENLGAVRSQFLESSNVQLVEEMVRMIVAQRAYEISSKAITTSDEMLQTASNIKR